MFKLSTTGGGGFEEIDPWDIRVAVEIPELALGKYLFQSEDRGLEADSILGVLWAEL